MISRTSARLIAETYAYVFRRFRSAGSGRGGFYTVDNDRAYDFLYDRGYATWFCNAVRGIRSLSHTGVRPLKDFIMGLHTGESVTSATPDWTWEERKKLGQRLLHDLAENILGHLTRSPPASLYERKKVEKLRENLMRSLELAGYSLREGKLLAPEQDALDVQHEMGVLHSLYRELRLANEDTAFHHLELSEEHYLSERWDDSISNSRKFLECVLTEVAKAHCVSQTGVELEDRVAERPTEVRKYLKRADLLDGKEAEALGKVYGLLSSAGAHPYMAANEQARLLRHLALTFSQFAMLRLRGCLSSSQ